MVLGFVVLLVLEFYLEVELAVYAGEDALAHIMILIKEYAGGFISPNEG